MSKRPTPRKWSPRNPSKYVGDPTNIVSRSSWETRFMNWCDMNPNVVSWASEEVIIPYRSPVDNQLHRYFVDFAIKIKQRDGTLKKFLVEVKPYAQTQPPQPTKNKKALMESTATYAINQAKWEAATKYCESVGYTFQIVTEYELGLAK